jgi:hypothetical protein
MEQTKLLAEEKDQAQKEVTTEKPVEVSVVIPISEHHDDLRQLFLQYARELSHSGRSYEFIFVVDGPKQEALRRLCACQS